MSGRCPDTIFPFHADRGPVARGGDDFGAGARSQNGVLALGAGDGPVPREGLVLQHHARRGWRAEVIVALIATGAALVVEVPFVREAHRVVGGDALAERVFHRRADLGGKVQLDARLLP